jgi:hypothetical protein
MKHCYFGTMTLPYQSAYSIPHKVSEDIAAVFHFVTVGKVGFKKYLTRIALILLLLLVCYAFRILRILCE